MDLTKFTIEDLQALQAGDLSKVSTQGLQLLQAGRRGKRAAADLEADRKKYDPAADMSTGDRVLSGIGSGMTSVMRALGGGGLADRMGLPGTKEEADRIDAPLAATTAGKVGQVIGTAAP